jgi:branched-chain amino acid transport system substrate-binding protein
MSRRASFFLTALAMLLVSGCQQVAPGFECHDAIGCVEIAPGAPIKIGVLQALSGDMGPQGRGLLQCIELALDDRGRELLGHPVRLQIEDSQCSGEGGTTAALKITADPRIVGIVGPTCSGAAATAMKVISPAGLVMISGSSSAPSLTSVGGEPGPDWQPGFFRTTQNDALAGRAAANFAFRVLGVARAATINDGDPYTRGLADAFEQAFTELGGQIVLSTAVNKGDTDMRPVLNAVAASGAELMFFPVFRPEGDYIVLQAREVNGLQDVTLMSAEGLYFEAFIAAVGESAVGMYFNAPIRPEGPAYDAFVTRYEAKYQELPVAATPYDAHGYDAVNLLLHAIEETTVQDAKEDGRLYVGRQALRDTLYATSGYQGLTGRLTCDEYGDCGAIRLQTTRLDDPAAGMQGLIANVVYTFPLDK